jgi:hypothetical protein
MYVPSFFPGGCRGHDRMVNVFININIVQNVGIYHMMLFQLFFDLERLRLENFPSNDFASFCFSIFLINNYSILT